MKLSRPQVQKRLEAIESKVPELIVDRNTFARAFEDEAEALLGVIEPEDEAFVLQELEAIVERSGFNR